MSGLGGEAPVIGVDLGGTKILVGVVDRDNTILGRSKRSTPAEAGGPAILSGIVAAIDEALANAQFRREDVLGIGVGSPGPIDPERGVILFSSNMSVRDWPLATDLQAAVGRPTLLRNDVRAGGFGEFHLGAGRGCRNVLIAFVGTGIGGCVVVDGKIIEGSTGNAGEIGHVVVKAKGRSAAAVVEVASKPWRAGRPSPGE